MADMKVLDYAGLDYLTDKLAVKYVEKDGNKVLSTNDYTTAEKNKLSGIASGSQVNVLEGVQVNGANLPITNKKVNIDLSGYALKSDVSSVYKPKGSVATYDDLPETASVGDVYNVESDGMNYAWKEGGGWDSLGGLVDLSNYYTKGQVDSAIESAVEDMATQTYVNGQVDALNTEIGKKANSSDVYTKSQMDSSLAGKVPTTRKVNGKALTSDITLAPSDLGMSAITTAEIDALFTV